MGKDLNMRAFEGQVIAGKYRLVKYLSEGGFGAVFRAAHIAYELELREVAVKVSKRAMDDREARRMFGDALAMAKIADAAGDATLREHFVTVHDAGLCPEGAALGGHPYVVMELVRGGSLSSCLRAGPFPLKRAVQYFDQMLRAVAFMHSGPVETGGQRRPIIHRDIKPGNILIERRRDGEDVVKLSDFGLVVEVDTLLGWAQSGGDLAYLPPESFSRDLCSPQSDVYMLALVFYEMITGRNPFCEVGSHLSGEDEAKRRELRKLHLEARIAERFSLLEDNLQIRQHPAIGRVVRAALSGDMNSRPYKDACELHRAWREAVAEDRGPDAETPWDEVRRLTAEAEQCFAVQSVEQGMRLLHRAFDLNRDGGRVPDGMAVGCTYLVMVKRLLAQGRGEEAGRAAIEGYHRKRCRSTCEAVARYYEGQGSPLAAAFDAEARGCQDQE